MTTLGDIMVTRGGSVNPAKYPDDEFELYSIPAHDRGLPDSVIGSEIGSSKQIVQPGDVLVSKIIPHIRRARVVGRFTGRRQVASGEWIAFRGEAFDPNYLRHFLLSNHFHAQFMNTVAGVGGSLVRARPEHVKRISVPLPPLPEQRRMAAILDHADAIRAKRRQVLAHLDTLAQAMHRTTFGDRTWPTKQLAEVVQPGTVVTYGIVQAGPEYPGGVPYIRTGDIVKGAIVESGLRRTAPAIAARFERSRVRAGEIVMSIRATVGTTALVQQELDGANLTQGTARISPGEHTLGVYLLEFLRSSDAQRWIQAQVKGATFREITLGRLRGLQVPIPPLALQRDFVYRVNSVDRQRRRVERALAADDELFASLQSRAFRGEL